MSISSELTLLANTKESIRTSINNKGGSVGASDTFASYATAIANLRTGQSGNPLLTSIDVSDFSGTTFNKSTTYITSITIPSGVTTIANTALQYLPITSLTIPDSVTSIGIASIANCYSLTSLTIGTGLRTVNYTAFEHCDNLTSVYYRGSLADWCGINFGTYSFGSATLGQPLYNNANSRLYINNTAITGELTIPNTVTTLANGCFSGYKAITSVVIPNNVTTINGQVFGGCSNLTKINVGSGVTSIGTKAFYYCTGLTALIFNSTTPPTLADTDVLSNTNNCPIYVPAASVEAYKAASNWSTYASRIYAIAQVATVDNTPVYNYDLGMTSSTTMITSTNMQKMPTGTSLELAEGIIDAGGSFGNYTSITLPSTFTSFDDQGMIGNTTTTLTCLATTPPTAERNDIGGANLTAIYVPAASVSDYQAASGWSNFASIIQAISA